MKEATAENTLIFFVFVYWLFFAGTFFKLLVTLVDVLYYASKWTYTNTIYATISAALLARAVDLTLLHFVDEGRNLFRSASEEDLLFKILSSIPGYILITAYTLLALIWLSLLSKTYDLSSIFISRRASLLGDRTYSSDTATIVKHHLHVYFAAFNIFLYCSWISFFFLMWKCRHDLIYRIESTFTSCIAFFLVTVFGGFGSRVYRHYQHNPILSVERLHISKRVLGLILLCSAVFVVKLPFIMCSVFMALSPLTSFLFGVINLTFLEIVPFLIIIAMVAGKGVDEPDEEKAHFSFRQYGVS